MQHVFQLNIPLCPCSFSAAVYEPFPNTGVPNAYDCAPTHRNGKLQKTTEGKENKKKATKEKNEEAVIKFET